MTTIHDYTMALDRATLTVRSGAARWPTDRQAAHAVVLLAAHWLSLGEISPNLLRECAAYMSENEAITLAQTVGAIAMRGAGMADRQVAV